MFHENSKLKSIIIAILVLPMIGLFYDALNGFQILRHSKSIYGVIVGLLLTVFYVFIGETMSNWINLRKIKGSGLGR